MIWGWRRVWVGTCVGEKDNFGMKMGLGRKMEFWGKRWFWGREMGLGLTGLAMEMGWEGDGVFREGDGFGEGDRLGRE